MRFRFRKRIKEDELRLLVNRLRMGDSTVHQKIIDAHMVLALHLAKRYKKRFHYNDPQRDDCDSVAFTAVVTAVTKAEKTLVDDNITPYIVRYVTGALNRYMSKLPIISLEKTGLSRTEVSLNGISSIQEQVTEVNHHLKDIVNSAVLSPIDEYIIQQRLNGYTDDQIANQLGRSQSYVQKKRASIAERVERQLHSRRFPS